MSKCILSKIVNRTAVIQLNRPKALNALDLTMVNALYDAIMGFERDDSIDCIILESLDARAFCAGGDVRGIHALAQAQDYVAVEHFFRQEYRLNLAISQLKTSYISLIDGYCMGGGLGISVHGQFRVATEHAAFAMPECKLGFFPDVGGSYFLSRFTAGVGAYFALTGDMVRGSDGVQAGFATHYVKQVDIARLREALFSREDTDIAEVIDAFKSDAELGDFSEHEAEIIALFNADDFNTLLIRLSQRDDEWALAVKQKLRQAGPYAMQLTWMMLARGASLDLATCLEVELASTRIIATHPDFSEGIRAVLIDKDQSPHWQSRLPTPL